MADPSRTCSRASVPSLADAAGVLSTVFANSSHVLMYLSRLSEESFNLKKTLTVHIVPVSRHCQTIFKAQESHVFEAVLAQRFRHAALPANLQRHSLDLTRILRQGQLKLTRLYHRFVQSGAQPCPLRLMDRLL